MSLVFDHLIFSEIQSRDGVNQDRKALDEARHWLGRLTALEFRGPGDTIGAARTRLAREVGIRPSYAARMWNRAAEMTGVAGGAYRALRLAYDAKRIALDEAELENARKRHAEFIEETARLAAARAAADAAAVGGERQGARSQVGGVDRAGSRGPDE